MDSKSQHGYSLIELVVAVALAGILAAIALPGWNKLLPTYQLDSSVRQFQSELHNIKMRAAAVALPGWNKLLPTTSTVRHVRFNATQFPPKLFLHPGL